MTTIAPHIPALDDLPRPPKHVYYRGTWDTTLFTKCAAVVGSRRMTQYGRMVIEKLVPQLVEDGWVIVSGFMYGVDQTAHRECLACGGKTIAVLGWGITWEDFDHEDKKLIGDIEQNGLVISEWEDQKPALWTFPQRNRIVAAISSELYVVEAALKSGALITARIAQKLSRTVWAVPGPITSKTSEGTNQLLSHGHARMWLPKGELHKTQHSRESPIVKLLENEAMNASEIAIMLREPIDKIGAQLTLLVLAGEVTEREGIYYAC